MNPKNIAASVRARLANHATKANRPYQEVLQYYAMERLLYRLSKSPHGSSFVLKGALMLRVWGAATNRPTKDVDLLGQTSQSLDHIAQVFRDVCAIDVEPDGMVFDAGSVVVELIKEDAEYHGVLATHAGARMHDYTKMPRGVRAPGEDELVFSAIIGIVEVVDSVESSRSKWFMGPCGLVLAKPRALKSSSAMQGSARPVERSAGRRASSAAQDTVIPSRPHSRSTPNKVRGVVPARNRQGGRLSRRDQANPSECPPGTPTLELRR